MAEFTDLDDVSVIHSLKLWGSSDDAALAALCRGLLFRQLYKTIDLTHLGEDAGKLARVIDSAKSALATAGGDPAYDLFYDEPEDTPYEAYSPDAPRRARMRSSCRTRRGSSCRSGRSRR